MSDAYQTFTYRPRYYRRDGTAIYSENPLDEWMKEWTAGGDGAEGRTVALSKLWNGACVSTVYIGMDHAFSGPPKIFETMVFAPSSVDVDRYSNEAEARAGHEAMCRKWRWRLPRLVRLVRRIREV